MRFGGSGHFKKSFSFWNIEQGLEKWMKILQVEKLLLVWMQNFWLPKNIYAVIEYIVIIQKFYIIRLDN